ASARHRCRRGSRSAGCRPPPPARSLESSAASLIAFPKLAASGKRQIMNSAELIAADRGQDAVAIHLVAKDGFGEFARSLSGPQRAALAAQKFTGAGYQVGIVPDGANVSPGWFAVGGVANPDSLSSWCMA